MDSLYTAVVWAAQGGALAVEYESTQMVESALRLPTADEDAVAKNAYLESCLLHARALIEFLLGNGRATDIRAEHLAPGWELGESACGRFKARKDAIDKHLAHLTWTRVTGGAPACPYPN